MLQFVLAFLSFLSFLSLGAVTTKRCLPHVLFSQISGFNFIYVVIN